MIQASWTIEGADEFSSSGSVSWNRLKRRAHAVSSLQLSDGHVSATANRNAGETIPVFEDRDVLPGEWRTTITELSLHYACCMSGK